MTAPGGPAGPRPQGPAGPGPARPDQPSAAAIVAAIDDNVRSIAASLPDLAPSAMARVAGIFRRNWQRVHTRRLDRAA